MALLAKLISQQYGENEFEKKMNITQSKSFCVLHLLSLFREIQRRIFCYIREFQEPFTNHKRRLFQHRNDFVVELN